VASTHLRASGLDNNSINIINAWEYVAHSGTCLCSMPCHSDCPRQEEACNQQAPLGGPHSGREDSGGGTTTATAATSSAWHTANYPVHVYHDRQALLPAAAAAAAVTVVEG
jgi:hypothetical protein